MKMIEENQSTGTLIHITEAEDGQQTVNARELHRFLESGRDFSTWIQQRIESYKFIEGRDFARFSPNLGKTSGGRPSIEYLLTVDMAMALSMVENNAKGEQARAYFIACKKHVDAAIRVLEEDRDRIRLYHPGHKAFLTLIAEQIQLGVTPDLAAKCASKLTNIPKGDLTAYAPPPDVEQNVRLLTSLMAPGVIYNLEEIASLLPEGHPLTAGKAAAYRARIGKLLEKARRMDQVVKIHGRTSTFHLRTTSDN